MGRRYRTLEWLRTAAREWPTSKYCDGAGYESNFSGVGTVRRKPNLTQTKLSSGDGERDSRLVIINSSGSGLCHVSALRTLRLPHKRGTECLSRTLHHGPSTSTPPRVLDINTTISTPPRDPPLMPLPDSSPEPLNLPCLLL